MNNLDFDSKHIWHPYTSMTNPLPVIQVIEAKGVRLKLDSGQELIDGMSSWWAAIHGYNHPILNAAITKQLTKMSHVMFGGITHEPAILLARKLIEITPKPLEKIFFSDSGSVSVEIAIKMSLQYYQALNNPKKHKLCTIRGGYHGDTFGAMAVCDPITGMHNLFSHNLTKHFFIPRPRSTFNSDDETLLLNDVEHIANIFDSHHLEIAAMILEPIVQGAGGMYFYSPKYLQKIRTLCDQYNILLIFDEIATGFGRTGRLFASEHANVNPDILCVGKALTGGYMTLAATLTTDKIAKTISSSNPGIFMHGPTFMANPLACAVALSSINLLLDSDFEQNIKRIEQILSKNLSPLSNLKTVSEVRVLGAIGVIEMKEPVNMKSIQKSFVEHNIWIRPFGKLIYTMPPYIISDIDLETLTENICAVVEKI